MGILGREAQVYKRISFECVCMCLKEQRMLVDWSTWLLGLKRLFEVNICFGNIRISTLSAIIHLLQLCAFLVTTNALCVVYFSL